MRIENTSRIPTKELRPMLSKVLGSSPLGKDARLYLRSGLYVKVSNAKYSRVKGRIFPDACEIHRKGKLIGVNGYIKLFVFAQTTMEDIAHTFAHELLHFKDWYKSVRIYPLGYVEILKVPWGKERRANAFADRVIKRIKPTPPLNGVRKGEDEMELKEDRPRIVCLCGSSRFIERMAILGWNLEKEGAIVVGLHLLPSYYGPFEDHAAEYEGVAEHFDKLHLRKIDLADEVFVVNVGGYIGESTRREIDYAQSLGKPVKYLEALAPIELD